MAGLLINQYCQRNQLEILAESDKAFFIVVYNYLSNSKDAGNSLNHRQKKTGFEILKGSKSLEKFVPAAY